MNAKRVVFAVFLVLALVQGIQCGISHRILERIALPQLGQHTHNAASSAASAASAAYGSFRTYLTNVYPRLALRPSLLERINEAIASSSSSAASGNIMQIAAPEPIVPFVAPAVVPSELVSPVIYPPVVVPSDLDNY